MTTLLEYCIEKCAEKFYLEIGERIGERLQSYSSAGSWFTQTFLKREFLGWCRIHHILLARGAIDEYARRLRLYDVWGEEFDEKSDLACENIVDRNQQTMRDLLYPLLVSLKEDDVVYPPNTTGHERVQFLKTWRAPVEPNATIKDLFKPIAAHISDRRTVLEVFLDGQVRRSLEAALSEIDAIRS